MSDCYLGEIRMFGGNYAPRFWNQCFGQLLPIQNNSALYSLLGTTYGGNGTTNFGLPDLRGRLPVNTGTGPGLSQRIMGQMYGTETVTLSDAQTPGHTHAWMANSTQATSTSASGNVYAAQTAPAVMYEPNATIDKLQPAATGTVAASGHNQPHLNQMPGLGITFIIALQGIYPSRN